ncbi:MAG: ester cyclase [Chloroflexota bacterium]|nr:ester cyclase [Chloroflexota bacterium]
MSTEANKALVDRYYQEFWSEGNVAVADEIFDPNVSFYSPVDPDGIHGAGDLSAFVVRLRESFPDLNFTILDRVVTGDKVVYRWVLHGTHLGVYAAIPPTGNTITLEGMSLFYVADGKITQIFSYIDLMRLVSLFDGEFPRSLKPG